MGTGFSELVQKRTNPRHDMRRRDDVTATSECLSKDPPVTPPNAPPGGRFLAIPLISRVYRYSFERDPERPVKNGASGQFITGSFLNSFGAELAVSCATPRVLRSGRATSSWSARRFMSSLAETSMFPRSRRSIFVGRRGMDLVLFSCSWMRWSIYGE